MLKVNFSYITITNNKNEHTNLVNNNFNLTNSNIYTIIGKNGSGKSTLLWAIIRMLEPKTFSVDGSVTLENTDLYLLDETTLFKFRTQNFRFVFQDPISAFDPLRKLKYYFSLIPTDDKEIAEEFTYFQLPKYSDVKKLYPHELSVGMLQRVSIILALLSKPKVLLLDEPTSALDLPIMNLLKSRLVRYVSNSDRAILLVTQNISFAKAISNYIAILKDGTLSKFQTTSCFFEENNL